MHFAYVFILRNELPEGTEDHEISNALRLIALEKTG